MPAFRRALELGADGIELDVHATRDGIVVVHHDAAPLLPDGSRGRPIADCSWAELVNLEVAPGMPMPTLGDVISLVGARATLYVELKGEAIADAVLATLRASTSGRFAVHSFDHAAVERLSFRAPELARGVLFEHYPDDPAGVMRATGARDVWAECRIVDKRLVGRVHDVGGRVVAWTVNDTEEAARLAELGVDALCGDDVRLLPGESPVKPAAVVRGS